MLRGELVVPQARAAVHGVQVQVLLQRGCVVLLGDNALLRHVPLAAKEVGPRRVPRRGAVPLEAEAPAQRAGVRDWVRALPVKRQGGQEVTRRCNGRIYQANPKKRETTGVGERPRRRKKMLLLLFRNIVDRDFANPNEPKREERMCVVCVVSLFVICEHLAPHFKYQKRVNRFAARPRKPRAP